MPVDLEDFPETSPHPPIVGPKPEAYKSNRQAKESSHQDQSTSYRTELDSEKEVHLPHQDLKNPASLVSDAATAGSHLHSEQNGTGFDPESKRPACVHTHHHHYWIRSAPNEPRLRSCRRSQHHERKLSGPDIGAVEGQIRKAGTADLDNFAVFPSEFDIEQLAEVRPASHNTYHRYYVNPAAQQQEQDGSNTTHIHVYMPYRLPIRQSSRRQDVHERVLLRPHQTRV